MKVLDLAYYINKKAEKKNIAMDNKRLQKLLYYIQGYCLKDCREPAFEEEFEHWIDGPVINDVYIMRRYNSDFFLESKRITIPKPIAKIVDDVLECSKELSTEELIQMTHLEDPWKNHTNYNEKIPNKEIQEFFDRNDPLRLRDYESKYQLSQEEKRKFYLELLEKRSDLYKELAKL